MSKLKNNKVKISIIGIILILLISLAVFFIMKDNIKNKQTKLETKETLEKSSNSENNNIDNNLETNKTTDEESEENIENSQKDSNNKQNNKKDENNIKKPTANNSNKNNNQDKSNNNEIKNNENNNSSNTNTNNDKSDNNETNNPNNNISNTEKNENTNNNNNSSNTPDIPVIKEDKNDTLRKKIENSYGVKILYGDEIGSYRPKRITPVKLTDESTITNYLNRVNTELAKYPKGFFNDFNKKNMPLTIYLIKSANGAFSGFTDYEFMTNIKMTLATDFNFEYTLHHEMMHYIDCYLNIVMYPKNPYDEYEKLNPTGFSYGHAQTSEIYNMGNNPRGAYFVSQYGSTHVTEDRAEVFKYMMARAYAPIGCFEAGETINKKAKVISNQIKTYFPSVHSTAHWDRFIK